MKLDYLDMAMEIFLLSFYCWYSCGSHGTNNTTKAITAVCLLNSASGSSVEGKAVFTEINNKVTLEIDVKGLSFGYHAFHIHEFWSQI